MSKINVNYISYWWFVSDSHACAHTKVKRKLTRTKEKKKGAAYTGKHGIACIQLEANLT